MEKGVQQYIKVYEKFEIHFTFALMTPQSESISIRVSSSEMFSKLIVNPLLGRELFDICRIKTGSFMFYFSCAMLRCKT